MTNAPPSSQPDLRTRINTKTDEVAAAPAPELIASPDARFDLERTLADGVTPLPLLGPFADIEGMCSQLASRFGESADGENALPCDADDRFEHPAAGIDEAVVLVYGAPFLSEVDASLAVRHGTGWYLAPAFEELSFSTHGERSSEIRADARARSLAPGFEVLELEFFRFTNDREEGSRTLTERSSGALVCAAYPDGAPRCTAVIPDAIGDGEDVAKLRRSFPGDGTVLVEADAKQISADVAPLLGAHDLGPLR